MTCTKKGYKKGQMSRLHSLQSLRLLAAVCVVEFHLWFNYLGVPIGHPGTDYFFVLVGLVAAYSQSGYISSGKGAVYLLDRIVRLYVTFIPLFFIDLFFKRQEATWDWVWHSFLFVPQPDRLPVIGPSWMISHFLLFYFLFAVVIWSRHELVIWGIFVIWAVCIAAYAWGGWQTQLPKEWSEVLFYERNLDFIFGYAAGVLLRRRVVAPPLARGLLWSGCIGVIFGTILLNAYYDMPGRSLWLGLPVTMFALGIASLEQSNAPSRWVSVLSWRWLVYLGAASYTIYLSHGLTIGAWNHFLSITPLWTPVITICAVAVGVIGYRLWEAPLIAGFKRRNAPRRIRRPAMPARPKTQRTSLVQSALVVDSVAPGVDNTSEERSRD
jgi:peptidoglycan/LPS O-acetylase OafA/YrhL